MTMSQSNRRALLYGTAAPVLGFLLWLLLGYEAEPDFVQLLRGVDMQLRLAHGIPAVDRDGNPVAAHQELLANVERDLSRARRQQPDSPVLIEFEGFFWQLKGNPREAASCYRRARQMTDCTAEQRDVLLFNEARMLESAGHQDEALTVLESAQSVVAEPYRVPCLLERSALLHELGRDEDASELLGQVMKCDAPVAWVSAAKLFVAMRDLGSAEAALLAASPRVPIADAHLARLKLVSGDVDSCWQLLERAATAVPAEMRRLLREEPAAWQAISSDARFVRWTEPVPATPGR